MIVRFRRSRGDERQQLKWMTFAAVVPRRLGWSSPGLVGDHGHRRRLSSRSASACSRSRSGSRCCKYRLYDVDRLIIRTLVYGALTVVLGAAYVGLVLAGQALFSSFAGGSNLAIAASTLVVAALFLPCALARAALRRPALLPPPLRRAAHARGLRRAAARAGRAGDAEHDLALVVQETIQPSHVSLWLRSER